MLRSPCSLLKDASLLLCWLSPVRPPLSSEYFSTVAGLSPFPPCIHCNWNHVCHLGFCFHCLLIFCVYFWVSLFRICRNSTAFVITGLRNRANNVWGGTRDTGYGHGSVLLSVAICWHCMLRPRAELGHHQYPQQADS